MCGRYFIRFDDSEMATYIHERLKKQASFDYATSEVFPSQHALVHIYNQEGIDICVKKWGISSRSLLINARVETLNEKVTYKKIRHNRCAVLANGFYEWKNKKKIYITKRNEPYIYFAALYNEKNEFVILTGESECKMKEIHDRTPMIMNYDDMIAYLKDDRVPAVNNEYLQFQIVE